MGGKGEVQGNDNKIEAAVANPENPIDVGTQARAGLDTSKALTEDKNGEVHRKYFDKIKEVSKDDTESYRKKLRDLDTYDIRSNHRLLAEPKDKESNIDKIIGIQSETVRRIAAFTEHDPESLKKLEAGQIENHWFTINYSQVKSIYEQTIGMGDFCVDPNITEVLVKKNGEIIHGYRNTNTARRMGFYTEAGEYIATFDGDEFMILSNTYADPTKITEDSAETKAYVSKIDAENEIRVNTASSASSGFEAFTTDEWAIDKLNQNREEKDGQEIIKYAQDVCKKFEVPYSVLKELILVESAWKADAAYKGPVNSNATGLGQFVSGTWAGFIKYCNQNNVFEEKWGNPPLSQQHRTNPYASLYATAWLMKQNEKSFGEGFKSMSLEEQGRLYYLAHHEGAGGWRQHIALSNAMENEGITSVTAMKEAYEKNPSKYNHLLSAKQIERIDPSKGDTKAIIAGRREFFSVIATARRIGRKANSSYEWEHDSLTEATSFSRKETAVVGASIVSHLAGGGLLKYPNNFGKGGLSTSQLLEISREKVSKPPFNFVILDGGAGNDFPSASSIAGSSTEQLKATADGIFEKATSNLATIIQEAQAKGIKVAITTHNKWDNYLMERCGNDPAKFQIISGLNKRITDWVMQNSNADKKFAIHEVPTSGGWHPGGNEYKTIAQYMKSQITSAQI